MRLRLASVSVDLDPLRCYSQIHGLTPPAGPLADVILRRALPRLLALFDRFGIKATLFVVGQDLVDSPPGRALLAEAAAAGHELGNHSQTHPYDLARLPRAEIEREIGACHAALRSLHPEGRPPLGFRAPGYELSLELFDVLEAHGYRYDTSIWPCPPYYLAKLAVMAKMALRGERSASIIGRPQAQFGPTQPYRPDPRRPWRRGQSGLVELPVAVTPALRLPAIGTFLLLSERLRSLLLSGMQRQPFFNLELHGIDLIDAEADGIPAELVARQPDLRVPLAQKLSALAETFEQLRDRRTILPLHEIAEQVQRHGSVVS
jgi:hypothetical protein